MTIIISRNGRNARKVERTTIEREEDLQRFIYNNPESVPLYEIDEDIKLLIVAREFETESGPIDALGLDARGEVYLIETKLYKNTDKRRVVAQMLDYGAALWHGSSDFNELFRTMDEHVNRKFSCSLQEKLREFYGLSDEELGSLLDNMKKNLGEGNYRFVVLMDRIDGRLKDLITFINQNSAFDIFGVELQYYTHEGLEIMIPKLYGAEVKKRIEASSGGRRRWDEESFFAEATSRLAGEHLAAVRRLYEFSKQHADSIRWGSGTVNGSFNPKFDRVSVRSIYNVFTNGYIEIRLDWLDDTEDAKRYRDLLGERLGEIGELRIPSDFRTKPVRLSPEEWVPVVEPFIKVIRVTVTE